MHFWLKWNKWVNAILEEFVCFTIWCYKRLLLLITLIAHNSHCMCIKVRQREHKLTKYSICSFVLSFISIVAHKDTHVKMGICDHQRELIACTWFALCFRLIMSATAWWGKMSEKTSWIPLTVSRHAWWTRKEEEGTNSQLLQRVFTPNRDELICLYFSYSLTPFLSLFFILFSHG